METKGQKLTNWVINIIRTEYKDEICLLLGHTTLKLEKDMAEAPFSYYVPASDKGLGLARTFIIDGIGYDLFPMSWERIEKLADLTNTNTNSLATARILYARNESDRKRFTDLQAKLKSNLQDPKYRLNKALEKLDIAMGISQTMQFEEALYKVRKASGYIADYLSVAVATTNGTYFYREGYTNPFSDLTGMPDIPKDFIRLYEEIVKASSGDELKKLCHEMIYNTRQFLSAKKGTREKSDYNRNFKDLASWYQELIYTWRRVYHFCDENDPGMSFRWGCFLQSELDIVREEFGLDEMDLMGVFKAADMTAYRKRAEELEKKIVSVIEQHGVVIDQYDSVEDFLKKNE